MKKYVFTGKVFITQLQRIKFYLHVELGKYYEIMICLKINDDKDLCFLRYCFDRN